MSITSAKRRKMGPRRPGALPKPKAIDKPIALSEAEIAFARSLVIYEDAHVLVLNKPAGLSSQGGRGQVHTLDELLWAFARSNGKRPRLVHRLDRDTSGVILTAKTQPAASFLGKALMNKQFAKTYLALVAPPVLPDQGLCEIPLRRVEEDNEAYIRPCAADHSDAMASATRYAVIARNAEAALVRCEPLTGRMHQIRVHMQALSAPLAGDPRYGGALRLGGVGVPRLMLHAASLCFPHPEGGTRTLTAPVPVDMAKVLAGLELELPVTDTGQS